MRQSQHTLAVRSTGKGLIEFTDEVTRWLVGEGYATGLLTLYCRHTSASLLIQENADPSVLRDLSDFFSRVAPESFPYAHDTEGPDDMPAHIRAALTQTSLSIPIVKGRMALGTWQGLYLFEHRNNPHVRQIVLHAVGE
jgi:secondary thiamine-phosphate synthase enzyme